MKKTLQILFLLICQLGQAQDFTTCTIYQFAKSDSAKIHIALVQKFNKKGLVISKTYTNYKRNSAEGYEDGTYKYYYTDTLVTNVIFINSNKDTFKTVNHYDKNNRLIKVEQFECTKRLKKEIDKGLGRPGGCVVFNEDFEKHRTWSKTNEINYTYDQFGRKIKSDNLQDYDKEYKYDELSRIIEEIGYSSGQLTYKYKDNYTYFNGGYRYTTVYYNENGEPKKPEYTDIIFSPIYSTTIYTDDKNRIIKEVVTTEKQKKISTELSYYDNKDRLIRTVFFDGDDKKEITHLFEYK